MLKVISIFGAGLMLTACLSVPPDFEMASDARQGVIAIEIERSANTWVGDPQMVLAVSRIDPATGQLTGEWVPMQVSPSRTLDDRLFFVGKGNPGQWVVARVAVQRVWHACFNGGTQRFEVKGGRVNLIGRVNVEQAMRELATKTPGVSRGQDYMATDTPRFTLTATGEPPGWSEGATAWLRARFPLITAPVEVAAPQAATFPIIGKHWSGLPDCAANHR